MIIKKVNLKQAQGLLPRRTKNSNKYTSGTVLVIAGSEAMKGAAVLTATAAGRSGAGLVYWLCQDLKLQLKNPDFISVSLQKINWDKINAVVIGPGLEPNQKTLSLLKKLLQKKISKVVVDAGALTVLSHVKIKIPENWILTPHAGELSKLIGKSSRWINENRLEAVQMAQRKFKCVVILKGYHSLIANEENVFQINSGHACLAKAGTGDVLAGMIAGFLAQGLESTSAAQLGVYVHGYLSQIWVKKNDEISLMASDLLEMIPSGLKKIRIAKK